MGEEAEGSAIGEGEAGKEAEGKMEKRGENRQWGIE